MYLCVASWAAIGVLWIYLVKIVFIRAVSSGIKLWQFLTLFQVANLTFLSSWWHLCMIQTQTCQRVTDFGDINLIMIIVVLMNSP